MRDVHEEGIEPHPGPWFITKNINGMNNKKRQCQVFKNIKIAHSKTPIGAIMLQEHHLKADAAKEADKLAHDFRLLFLCNPIPQADHKGGTAIIIPYDSIELKGGETFHDAVDRIRGTLLKREHGRIVAAHAVSPLHSPTAGDDYIDGESVLL